MLCQDIMKTDIATVSPKDTVQDAARRMRAENIGFLPVCSEERKVFGAITDRDLAIRVVAEALPPGTLIREVLTQEIVSCHPDDDLKVAEERMAENHKSRIMCIDRDHRLVGVISLSDIAQTENALEAGRTLRLVSDREAQH